jgi:hypothetical protein
MMTTYRRYSYLVEHGYVSNRMTLKRRIESGTFPPPSQLGPNTIAWTDEQLAEVDRRARAGITAPNESWLRALAHEDEAA